MEKLFLVYKLLCIRVRRLYSLSTSALDRKTREKLTYIDLYELALLDKNILKWTNVRSFNYRFNTTELR